MFPASTRSGHSADVQMYLLWNGSSMRIAQLGPDFIILDEPTHQPAGDGVIVLKIDGEEKRWAVHIPEVSRAMQKVPILLPTPQTVHA